MKKTLRVLALILAVLCLVPAVVACGGNGDEGNQGGNGTPDPGAVDTSDPYATKLPEYDWEEDSFYILGKDGGAQNQFTSFEISREAMDGTVVGDAVYTRNENLKKKYNFIVEQELVSNTYNEAQTLYDAQDDVYDLVIYIPNRVFNHAASGYLTDLYGVDYLDFEHPAWSSYINTELTVGGKLYCTSNKFLLQDKARTYTMFYNRELAREHDLGYLEDYVENNTWTLEEFEKCSKLFSFDIDGGGAGGVGDSFGVVAESHASFAALLYGAGFTLGTNDGENITLTGATTAMDNIVVAAGKIWFDKTLVTVPSDFPGAGSGSSMEIYLDRRALFMIGFPSDFDRGLNERCTFEFGFVPFPKYDETQERYYNMMNTIASGYMSMYENSGDSAYYQDAIETYQKMESVFGKDNDYYSKLIYGKHMSCMVEYYEETEGEYDMSKWSKKAKEQMLALYEEAKDVPGIEDADGWIDSDDVEDLQKEEKVEPEDIQAGEGTSGASTEIDEESE